MAEHQRRKTEKLREYWKLKAKRQYLRDTEKRKAQMREQSKRSRFDMGLKLQYLFNAAKHRAKTNGLEFTITREWLDLQPRMCAVTGVEFEIRENSRGPLTPSLDRIDSSKGYTPENTQLVACWYNLGKSNWEDGEMQDMILVAADAIRARRGAVEVPNGNSAVSKCQA